jgi:hypothetical protein
MLKNTKYPLIFIFFKKEKKKKKMGQQTHASDPNGLGCDPRQFSSQYLPGCLGHQVTHLDHKVGSFLKELRGIQIILSHFAFKIS